MMKKFLPLLALFCIACTPVAPETSEEQLSDGMNESSAAMPETVDPIENPVTLTGTTVCLPHRDTSGPTTLECAIGLQTEDGTHYALDVSGIQEQGFFDTGVDVTLRGMYVPIEAISSDHWRIYDIRGIIRVEEMEQQ